MGDTTMKQRFYAAHTNAGAVAVTAAEDKLITFYADRLVKTYESASEDVRLAGASWYTVKAATLAATVAEECRISFEEAAAIVAVCSPRTRWGVQTDYTVAMVNHLLDGGAVETAPRASLYFAGIEKAQRILAGDFEAVHGPKVEPFYRNICGDGTVVTLDVWAIRAALGNTKLGEDAINPWTKGRKRMLLDAAYHRAAGRIGECVAAVQAVVWVVIRGAVD
jgi:hypothetical protein